MNDNVNESMNKFAKEVWRIRVSPYAVSLKVLHNILQHVDQYNLEFWADANECRIEALVDAVLEGLQVWPYTLNILQVLSRVSKFRNAIVKQEPKLIDSVLREAISPQGSSSKHPALCVALLSCPLPEDVSVPALVPSFFQQILEAAVEKPSTPNVRLVYSLISGCGSDLLDILPNDKCSQLQERLMQILQVLDDTLAILLSLAVFARISSNKPIAAKRHEDLLSPMDAPLFNPSAKRHDTAMTFFTKKASKTLDLVMLQVICCCSNNSTLGRDEAFERLGLAREIIGAIDQSERHSWLKSNPNKTKKLYEKVMRQELDGEIRSMVFEVIASISHGMQLPGVVVGLFQSLCKIHRVFSLQALEQYATKFDESFVHNQLWTALRLSGSYISASSQNFAELCRSSTMISGISNTIPESSNLRQYISHALTSNELSESIDKFLAYRFILEKGNKSHDQQAVCPVHFQNIQKQLSRKLCSLVLRTALLATTDEVRIRHSLAIAVLEKEAQLCLRSLVCHNAQDGACSTKIGMFSLFEAGSTPAAVTSSCDWRAKLADGLRRDSTRQHEFTVRLVGEVCRDLEMRCSEAEAPLRKEQANTEALLCRLEAAESKTAALEAKIKEQALMLDCLQAERSRLDTHIDISKDRVHVLTGEMQEVRQQRNQAKRELEKAERASKEATAQRELEYLATITRRDDVIEQQEAKLLSADARTKDLMNDCVQLKTHVMNAEQKLLEMETVLEKRTDEASESKELLLSKELEMQRQAEVERRMKLDHQNLLSEVHDVRAQNQSNIIRLQDKESLFESKLLRLQQDYEREISEKSLAGANQREFYDNDIRVLKDQIAQDQQTAANESCKQKANIAELQEKVDSLRKECEDRAFELAQVQELSSRLLSVSKGKLGVTLPSCGRRESSRQSGPSMQDLESHVLQQEDVLGHGRMSDPSVSSDSSSAIKESKRKQSILTPVAHQAGSNKLKTSRGNYSRSKRQPLQDCENIFNSIVSLTSKEFHDIDASPGKTAVVSPLEKEKYAGAYELDADELSFGSDAVSSTAKENIQDWPIENCMDGYDETTIDC